MASFEKHKGWYQAYKLHHRIPENISYQSSIFAEREIKHSWKSADDQESQLTTIVYLKNKQRSENSDFRENTIK